MNVIRRIIICLGLCVAMATHGQDIRIEDVLEDIFNQLSEDGDLAYEDIEEELLSIAENPMDLNKVTGEDLSRLMFLSDEQIDAILMYQYQHGFRELYELQLIDCLKDYEIRNLLPFVRVDSLGVQEVRSSGGEKMYFREVFHYAKHEITLRADARNIEDYENDPMYGKLRYRFDYQKKGKKIIYYFRSASLLFGVRFTRGDKTPCGPCVSTYLFLHFPKVLQCQRQRPVPPQLYCCGDGPDLYRRRLYGL